MMQVHPLPLVLRRLGAVCLAVGALAFPLLHAVSPASAAVLPAGSSGGANLVFDDEFDGSALNSSRWRTCSWWADTTCSIETNKELELYTPNNVSVGGGVLTLQARRETATAWNGKTYNYTSGMISSGGRSGSVAPGFSYKYGYAEARVKVPAGKGLWPAFWTLPTDYSWPPEIDVMEILGDKPNQQEMHYHYLDGGGTHRGPGQAWVGPDFSAGWHTFGVDWQPSALVWYVDGVERWRFTDASAITSKPQYLLLNLAVGGNWPGSPDASTPFPSNYLVDYVRVWDRFGSAGTPTTAAPVAPTTTVRPTTTTTVAKATTTTVAPTTTTVAPTTTTTVAPPPAGPASGYAGAVTADGPVSYWRLGETSAATAADSVGNNPGAYQNGVATGAGSLVPSDAANLAASFDGADDLVAVPSSAGLSPTNVVSVEAWVRPSAKPAAGQFASVVSKREAYSIQFNGPRIEFTTIVGITRRRVQAPASAVVPGQTYHVVGTFDGTTQRLYLNGVQVASAKFSGPFNANANSVLLGSWDTRSEFLPGTVDEVAVYAKVLTAAQVADHYNRGRG
jgi:beta-glucanase (GH16 family)